MSNQETSIEDIHEVVVNEEGQYSIWLADKAVPPGWKTAGYQGTKVDCLAHINVVWTDIRPLSLIRQTAALSQG